MIHFEVSKLSRAADRPVVRAALARALEKPINDFYSRPRKEFRGQLVNAGFDLIHQLAPTHQTPACLANEDQALALKLCAEAIEALHTGSLIVDDIQDESELRRGGPCLHLRYGLPQALNAGNWLYFYAFERLRQVPLTSECKIGLYELTEQILREAHLGQALDVSSDIGSFTAPDIIEISRASLELKSGALMGLALGMGALVAGATPDQLKLILNHGVELGVSLQMFDDLGNLRVDQPTPKHLEDLKLRRPSFVWWHLAESFPQVLPDFIQACCDLPDVTELAKILATDPIIETGRQRASEFQKRALNQLQENLQPSATSFQALQAIAERVTHAYI